ncbi:MAG: type II secretion system protein, partial [Mycoplasmatota bacterium]|nr:type II secretion system protein [Mycoplasmatota bacterium]
MKKKKNREGFTLVEVLAAVTILGILSVVAMVSINKVIQDAKEEHYVTAEDQLKLAGQSYVQQNRSS